MGLALWPRQLGSAAAALGGCSLARKPPPPLPLPPAWRVARAAAAAVPNAAAVSPPVAATAVEAAEAAGLEETLEVAALAMDVVADVVADDDAEHDEEEEEARWTSLRRSAVAPRRKNPSVWNHSLAESRQLWPSRCLKP